MTSSERFSASVLGGLPPLFLPATIVYGISERSAAKAGITVERPSEAEGAVRRRRRRRESRIPCDRRERGMVRRATVGSAAGGTAPQGKVAGESEKPSDGGFEGLRIQPCCLCSQERPMPGPRSRHAEAAPVAPPHRAGGGKGRRVRDVRHRHSLRETGGCAERFRGREGPDRLGRLDAPAR